MKIGIASQLLLAPSIAQELIATAESLLRQGICELPHRFPQDNPQIL